MHAFLNYTKLLTYSLLILPLTLFANEKIEIEPNNTLDDAEWIIVNDFARANKFDYANDEDWLVFYAQKGMPYDIEIDDDSVGQGIDIALEIYNELGEVEVNLFDFNFIGEGELLSWEAPDSGLYYIRVTNTETEFSADGHYKIKVYLPFAPNDGTVGGKIIDSCTKTGIKRARVSTKNNSGSTFSFHRKGKNRGKFSLQLAPGSYTITTSLDGYHNQEKSITIGGDCRGCTGTHVKLDMSLIPTKGCDTTPTPTPTPTPVKPTNITPPQVNIEQLKQQAVAVYDDVAGILTVKDVRVGDAILAVTLKANQDLSFTQLSATLLSKGVSNTPAFFNFDTLLADIPRVFYFNQLYSIQFRQLSAGGAFVIQSKKLLP